MTWEIFKWFYLDFLLRIGPKAFVELLWTSSLLTKCSSQLTSPRYFYYSCSTFFFCKPWVNRTFVLFPFSPFSFLPCQIRTEYVHTHKLCPLHESLARIKFWRRSYLALLIVPVQLGPIVPNCNNLPGDGEWKIREAISSFPNQLTLTLSLDSICKK